ncbi:MAG: hypothetical protein R3C14_38845 [Caldilineaceae bacterium]
MTDLTENPPPATNEQPLRYGCNPHQRSARVFAAEGALPFRMLNLLQILAWTCEDNRVQPPRRLS